MGSACSIMLIVSSAALLGTPVSSTSLIIAARLSSIGAGKPWPPQYGPLPRGALECLSAQLGKPSGGSAGSAAMPSYPVGQPCPREKHSCVAQCVPVWRKLRPCASCPPLGTTLDTVCPPCGITLTPVCSMLRSPQKLPCFHNNKKPFVAVKKKVLETQTQYSLVGFVAVAAPCTHQASSVDDDRYISRWFALTPLCSSLATHRTDQQRMAFPAWAPPRGMGDEAEGPAGGGLLKAGWENAGGGGGGGGDSASSFLQGLKRFSSVPQSTPPAAQAPATNNWQQQMHSMYSNPAPVGQPGFRASVSPAPHYPPAQAGGVDHQTPQGFSQPQAQGQPVVFESALLTEDEFQANSAIEYGSGIALSGCTIDRHLNDGDPMPQLESLSASVTLRITPTAIVFLHHYDRNFILEVPVSELYEINEDSEAKVVLLHTRSANGSALLELQCGSSRKRLGIYKTLCIRKNALERLKRQQQYLAKAHPSAQ